MIGSWVPEGSALQILMDFLRILRLHNDSEKMHLSTFEQKGVPHTDALFIKHITFIFYK